MAERKFDFWHDHSLNYLQMAFGFNRHAILHNPDGYGRRTGKCGDTIDMFLSVKKGRIQKVSYDTNGCINTHACANTVSKLAEGKTIDEGWKITPEDVTDFLETLPEENYYCAELAIEAFHRALANYQGLHLNSWKNP
ncbi:MAG: iron-sulfur cluster assembly scaffold protein [Nitrospinales bacterium]